MYGQMTAGSWIYIGSQGILQGTFETFAAAAARHFGGDLDGPARRDGRPRRDGRRAAARRDDERRAWRSSPRSIPSGSSGGCATRYLDVREATLDAAIDRALEAKASAQAISIGVRANAVDLLERLLARGIVPDLLTDQTSAHDELTATCPTARPDEDVDAAAARRPRRSTSAAPTRRWRATCGRCSRCRSAAPSSFDYGNNLRGQAKKAGVEDAFGDRRLRAALHPPALLRGEGAVPMGGALGRSGGHPRRPTARCSSSSRRTRRSRAGSRSRKSASRSRACPRASAGSATASGTAPGSRFNELVRDGTREGADRHRPRSPRRGLGRVARTARRRRCGTARTRSPTGRS